MQGSLLIYGGNKSLRRKAVETVLSDTITGRKSSKSGGYGADPDVFFVVEEEKKSIGIDHIRELNRFIQQKPLVSKTKSAVIEDAQNLTIPAQNALLKTLEDPPAYALIVLTAKTEESLLPTVTSRCRKISVGDYLKGLERPQVKGKQAIETGGEGDIIPEDITKEAQLPADLGERFRWAEEMSKKDKEEIVEVLEYMIHLNRLKMIEDPQNSRLSGNINLLMEVKKDLEETNVNTRLALEYLTGHLS